MSDKKKYLQVIDEKANIIGCKGTCFLQYSMILDESSNFFHCAVHFPVIQ